MTEAGITMEVKLSQSLKVEFPMLMIELDKRTDERLEQPANALASSLVTELGMSMEVSFGQFEKAPCSILMTDSGILMEEREEHPENAYSPMYSIELGNVTETIRGLRASAIRITL